MIYSAALSIFREINTAIASRSIENVDRLLSICKQLLQTDKSNSYYYLIYAIISKPMDSLSIYLTSIYLSFLINLQYYCYYLFT